MAAPGRQLAVSKRELQILHLVLLTGLRYSDVALVLKISERTVEGHMLHIFDKLGVNSKGELTALVFRDAELLAKIKEAQS